MAKIDKQATEVIRNLITGELTIRSGIPIRNVLQDNNVAQAILKDSEQIAARVVEIIEYLGPDIFKGEDPADDEEAKYDEVQTFDTPEK